MDSVKENLEKSSKSNETGIGIDNDFINRNWRTYYVYDIIYTIHIITK